MIADSPRSSPRPLWLDTVLGGLVLFIGVGSMTAYLPVLAEPRTLLRFLVQLAVCLGFAVAAALFRRSPAAGLALLWISGLLLMMAEMNIGYAQLIAVVAVSYGCGRYGSRPLLVVSGLSMPAAAFAGMLYLRYSDGDLTFAPNFSVPGTGVSTAITMVFFGAIVLAGPWLFGLVVRARQQTASARQDQIEAVQEAARTREVATLRAQQAQLARDVHDVVGHSLAVIVAQADSAKFLPDEELPRIREALANIATSARQSLGDVRQVLTATVEHGSAAPTPTGGLDGLIDGVRTGGSEVVVQDSGDPRPLPPELDVVAYRVLQEMLTNALKHGQPGRPIAIARDWSEDTLRLQVSNGTTIMGPPAQVGLGMSGMLRRLEAVGGSLDIRHADPVEATFTATAMVPVRPQAIQGRTAA